MGFAADRWSTVSGWRQRCLGVETSGYDHHVRSFNVFGDSEEPLPAKSSSLPEIADLRMRYAGRSAMRRAIMSGDADRVHVVACLHLLDPRLDRRLSDQLLATDERLSILRFCRTDTDPHARAEHDRVSRKRAAIECVLDEGYCSVDVAIGRAPGGGDDWSLTDVPLADIEAAQRQFARLRRELVGTVDALIDGELLRPRVQLNPTNGGVLEFELIDSDVDAVGRVRAFVTHVALLGAAADDLREQLRFAALVRTSGPQRDWMTGGEMRRRESRDSLDRLRAYHGAMADVRRICESTEM